jgi:hypothetical protein
MAVIGCPARCRHSDAPLTCLSESAAKLAEMGWDPVSIQEVDRGALPVLFGDLPNADLLAAQPRLQQRDCRADWLFQNQSLYNVSNPPDSADPAPCPIGDHVAEATGAAAKTSS